MRTRNWFASGGAVALPVGVHGSSRFSSWLADAERGEVGFEIAMVGDSTTINPNYQGYGVGIPDALDSLGIPIISTPMVMSASAGGSFAPSGGMCGQGVQMHIEATGTAPAAGTGNLYTLSARAAAADAPAVELCQYLIGADNFSGITLPYMFAGFAWDGAYIKTGETFTSGANQNFVRMLATNALVRGDGSAGVSLAYRLTYGKFSQTGGSFKIRPMKSTNTLISGTGNTGSISTAGGPGVETAVYSFVSPLTGAAGTAPLAVACSWDGWNTGNGVTGPACPLWHSVVRQGICGCGYSTLVGQGGLTTAQLATRLETLTGGVGGTGMFLAEYLRELSARNPSSSGRVCIAITSGQNDAASLGTDGTTYLTAARRILAALKHAWVDQLGFDEENFVVWFIPSHARVASVAEDRLQLMRVASRSWAAGGARAADGTRILNGVTVTDSSEMMSYDWLRARGLYNVSSNAEDSAHLRNSDLLTVGASGLYPATQYTVGGSPDGYRVAATKMFRALMNLAA
ncbi:MAG: hypothetical protein K8R92_00730 [Planctomycetes bacterium]|nr:hypothetical protein [Planctomycetota bacterium]